MTAPMPRLTPFCLSSTSRGITKSPQLERRRRLAVDFGGSIEARSGGEAAVRDAWPSVAVLKVCSVCEPVFSRLNPSIAPLERVSLCPFRVGSALASVIAPAAAPPFRCSGPGLPFACAAAEIRLLSPDGLDGAEPNLQPPDIRRPCFRDAEARRLKVDDLAIEGERGSPFASRLAVFSEVGGSGTGK